MAGVSASCKEERRDDWKKADTEDTVSPCTPSEDLEDLEQSGKAFNSGEEEACSIKIDRLLPIPCLRRDFLKLAACPTA